jgi:hypothetical protein
MEMNSDYLFIREGQERIFNMNLSLGPLLYYWSRDDILAFYDQAAIWPVERIFLGESVCSRRHLLRLPDWLALAKGLAAAGKQVVLSSQTLIESESDLKMLAGSSAMAIFWSRPTSGGRYGCCRKPARPSSPVPRSTSTTTKPSTCWPDWVPDAGCRRWRCPAQH